MQVGSPSVASTMYLGFCGSATRCEVGHGADDRVSSACRSCRPAASIVRARYPGPGDDRRVVGRGHGHLGPGGNQAAGGQREQLQPPVDACLRAHDHGVDRRQGLAPQRGAARPRPAPRSIEDERSSTSIRSGGVFSSLNFSRPHCRSSPWSASVAPLLPPLPGTSGRTNASMPPELPPAAEPPALPPELPPRVSPLLPPRDPPPMLPPVLFETSGRSLQPVATVSATDQASRQARKRDGDDIRKTFPGRAVRRPGWPRSLPQAAGRHLRAGGRV